MWLQGVTREEGEGRKGGEEEEGQDLWAAR